MGSYQTDTALSSAVNYIEKHIYNREHAIGVFSTYKFPQGTGGVCSAKFWGVAYDDAVVILNELMIFGQVFADDSIAIKGGIFLHQMMSRILKVVTKLEEWREE